MASTMKERVSFKKPNAHFISKPSHVNPKLRVQPRPVQGLRVRKE